jgi:hypothetical protein
VKRVLMVAFHFPPFATSSGIQRTLRFVQHLPAFGWEPIVLTAAERAYDAVSRDLLAQVPPGVVVERAFALDTARDLSVGGRYPAFLARPDRWMSWRFAAVAAGRRLVRRHRPAALWSTYPIATAHVVGRRLQARTGLPWIADFRDPMAQDGYPADPATWRSFAAIERGALAQARFGVFCTPGAAGLYARRYPALPDGRIRIIENGYDEESFDAPSAEAPQGPLVPGCVTLLHSGIVYPSERDPTRLFEALGRARREGRAWLGALRLRFRASGNDALLAELARRNGVEDRIELAPPEPYRMALREMLRADGLLVLQAANCNEQIPAKLYEYLRARRPVLGLTDPRGDTAGAMRAAGLEDIAPLDEPDAILAALERFVLAVRSGRAGVASEAAIANSTRRARAGELAALLDASTER